MNQEDKSITLNGRKIYYWEKGSMGQPTVVLLHGYPGNYESLMELALHLPEGYRIIIPSFPSCGGSESLLGKSNLKSYATWVDLFLQATLVKAPIIIGHSFGARVALLFSTLYPKKLSRLVLITPVLRADSLLVYVVLLKYKIAKLLPFRVRKSFLSSKLYEYLACKIVLKSNDTDRHEKIIHRGIEELQYVDPDVQIDLFEEFYNLDLIPLGKSVLVPTLLIAGGKDEVAILSSVMDLASHIKDAVVKVMKKDGHLLPFEKPKAAAKLIVAWLEGK